MSGSVQHVTLPERGEMQRQLLAMNSDRFLVDNLYPTLLNEAGKYKTVPGVAVLITLGIRDCLHGQDPATRRIVISYLAKIVDILVDDIGARSRIIATLRAAGLA
jgi:hypothetical protein